MSDPIPTDPEQSRIQSRQLLESLGMLAGMVALTVLACVGKADGMIVIWLVEGIIIGNEGITAFRIIEAASTPVTQQTTKIGVRGLSITVETHQWVETLVMIAGLALVGLMAWRGVVPGNDAVILIELAIAAFGGVTVARVVADRKGLLNANAAVRALGESSSGVGDSSTASGPGTKSPTPEETQPSAP